MLTVLVRSLCSKCNQSADVLAGCHRRQPYSNASLSRQCPLLLQRHSVMYLLRCRFAFFSFSERSDFKRPQQRLSSAQAWHRLNKWWHPGFLKHLSVGLIKRSPNSSYLIPSHPQISVGGCGRWKHTLLFLFFRAWEGFVHCNIHVVLTWKLCCIQACL